jgi:hypothetical protein
MVTNRSLQIAPELDGGGHAYVSQLHCSECRLKYNRQHMRNRNPNIKCAHGHSFDDESDVCNECNSEIQDATLRELAE